METRKMRATIEYSGAEFVRHLAMREKIRNEQKKTAREALLNSRSFRDMRISTSI
jgi:hypothetical protein